MSIGIHFDDDEEIERDSAIGGIHDMVDSGGFQDLRPVCQCNVDVPQRPICSCYLPMPPVCPPRPEPYILERKDYNEMIERLRALQPQPRDDRPDSLYINGLRDVFNILREYGIYVKSEKLLNNH